MKKNSGKGGERKIVSQENCVYYKNIIKAFPRHMHTHTHVTIIISFAIRHTPYASFIIFFSCLLFHGISKNGITLKEQNKKTIRKKRWKKIFGSDFEFKVENERSINKKKSRRKIILLSCQKLMKNQEFLIDAGAMRKKY